MNFQRSFIFAAVVSAISFGANAAAAVTCVLNKNTGLYESRRNIYNLPMADCAAQNPANLLIANTDHSGEEAYGTVLVDGVILTNAAKPPSLKDAPPPAPLTKAETYSVPVPPQSTPNEFVSTPDTVQSSLSPGEELIGQSKAAKPVLSDSKPITSVTVAKPGPAAPVSVAPPAPVVKAAVERVEPVAAVVAKVEPPAPLIVVNPLPVWELRAQDISIYAALKRWATSIGWQVSWEIGVDYPVTITDSNSATFEDAVDRILDAYAGADYPPKGCFHDNKVLRVVRRVGDGKECLLRHTD